MRNQVKLSAKQRVLTEWGDHLATIFRVAIFSLFVLGVGKPLSVANAQDELKERATWEIASPKKVQTLAENWAKEQKLEELSLLKIESLWANSEGLTESELLDRLGQTFAFADEKTKTFISDCFGDKSPVGEKIEFPFGGQGKTVENKDDGKPVNNTFKEDHLRLFYGRYLVQNRYYDEAEEVFKDLTLARVETPSVLLFYRGIVEHALLQGEPCKATLHKLLENEDALPKRYQTMSQLMLADLKTFEPDSLDEIARMMQDVERRLDLGRAGTKVRQKEEDILKKLDKKIKELEEEQKKQQQQQGQQGGNQAQNRSGNNPNNPLEDSKRASGKGAGNADKSKQGDLNDWGNLPPKERQEALQQVGRGHPNHYRRAIEEYFRRLARDKIK
ncbi:MAG: hypothetical protein MPJ24_00320 [Pirellulaceae bacterium]|nr:hypothetical protein [Pirellulaceae bacterium]